MTKTTMKEIKANLNKLGKTYKPDGITTLEAGAMHQVNTAGNTMTLTYQVMYSDGLRASDYLSHRSKESTANKEQYTERRRVVSMMVYTAKERASLAASLPKDATQAVKDARKQLQGRVTEKLNTIRKGLITQDKQQNPQPVEAKANARKTAIETLAEHLDKAIKLLQGDRPFPDTFDHDTACATLIAFKNTYTK